MAKKKSEETVEETEVTAEATETTEETEVAVEAAEAETEEKEAAKASKPKAKKADAADEKPAKKATKKAAKAEKPESSDTAAEKRVSKRAERVGIVASDKMMKTVTVRVDRQVKHPIYRKYIKRRKNFMAHDDLGSSIGDRVRIVETRPLSAKKRWRVVEIIQKAEK